VNPNGCFPEERDPRADRAAARRELGLDPEARIAIYVGHLKYYEGVDFLVRAFAAFLEGRERPGETLLVLGDGPMRRELERAVPARFADRVRFLGFLDRALMRRHLAAADVAAFTPPSAGYGVEGQRGGNHLKTVDYLHAGLPVLVPRAPYYDFVEEHGLGARYTPEDAAAFSRELGRLFDDPERRRAIGERAAAYCRSHLDWMVTLRPVFRVIERLAEEGAP
jgi:mannosyltransferase